MKQIDDARVFFKKVRTRIISHRGTHVVCSTNI